MPVRTAAAAQLEAHHKTPHMPELARMSDACVCSSQRRVRSAIDWTLPPLDSHAHEMCDNNSESGSVYRHRVRVRHWVGPNASPNPDHEPSGASAQCRILTRTRAVMCALHRLIPRAVLLTPTFPPEP